MTSQRCPHGIHEQPVRQVEWVHRDSLRANDYNPNHAAPPERALLKVSILSDGWTQPIVVREGGEIVDGFHRWKASGDPEVYAMTDGLVPVVRLRSDVDQAHQRMSTIRHNRARGKHGIKPMAEIARSLVMEHGVSPQALEELLGMEDEEVERLIDMGGMKERGAADDFNAGWVPDASVTYDDPSE